MVPGAEVGVDDSGANEGDDGGGFVGWLRSVEAILVSVSFERDIGTGFDFAGIAGHSDASARVVILEEVVICDDIEHELGVVFADAGDASQGSGGRFVEWVLFDIAVVSHFDWILPFFVGTVLFEDALIRNVELGVFHLVVPAITVIVDAFFSASPSEGFRVCVC